MLILVVYFLIYKQSKIATNNEKNPNQLLSDNLAFCAKMAESSDTPQTSTQFQRTSEVNTNFDMPTGSQQGIATHSNSHKKTGNKYRSNNPKDNYYQRQPKPISSRQYSNQNQHQAFNTEFSNYDSDQFQMENNNYNNVSSKHLEII